MDSFSFQNQKIAYKDFGSGPVIVFLHGFLEDHSIWNEIAEAFPDFRILLPDLPGHGESAFDGEKCEMQWMANGLDHLLSELNIEDPFVFGHSMGGYVGLELTKLRACHLTLVHSNFWEDDPAKKNDRNRVIEIVKENYKRFVREAIPGLFDPANLEQCRKVVEKLIDRASTFRPADIAAVTAGMRDRMDNAEVLRNQNINIIQGEKDPIITLDQLKDKMKEAKVEAPVFVLNGVGHMGIWEDTKGLIKAMNSIINQ